MGRNQRKVGIVLSYSLLIINSLVGILFTPFMVGKLGSSQYGLYQLVQSFAGYLMLLDFGTGVTLSRYISKFKTSGDERGQANYIAMSLIQTTILCIIVIIVGSILYSYIETIFQSSLTSLELMQAKKIFILMVINIAISLLDHVFLGINSANERFVYNNLIKMFRIFLRIGLITALLLNGYKAIALVIVDLFLTILLLIIDVYYVLIIKRTKIYLYKFDRDLFKESLIFSLFIFFQAIINQINANADKLILGIMTNTVNVARYAVAMQIFIIYNSISSVISGVFLPEATRLVHSGATNEELTDFVIKPGRIQFMILGIALIGFAIVGRDFMLLWMGSEYIISWYIAMIIMVPSTIELVENVVISVVLAKNKNGFRTTVILGVSLINIFITVILIKYIGFIGAPIGTAIAYIIGYVIILNIYYHKVLQINIPRLFKTVFSGTWFCLIISGISGIILNLVIETNGWWMLLAKSLFMIIIYIVGMLLFGLKEYEKKELYKLLKILKITENKNKM